MIGRNLERERELRKMINSCSFQILRDIRPICLYSVDSTQNYLINELKSKKQGEFVVSEVQTNGKGRDGRGWISDEGGLYLSITLSPVQTKAMDKLALLCASAVVRTFEYALDLKNCTIEQPNDVLIGGKKIGGILVDTELKGNTALSYVGIGVDLNNGGEWNKEMVKIATSYYLETKEKTDLNYFLLDLLIELDRSYWSWSNESAD